MWSGGVEERGGGGEEEEAGERTKGGRDEREARTLGGMDGMGAVVRDQMFSGVKLPATDAAQSARGLKLRVTWQMSEVKGRYTARTSEARREREEKWVARAAEAMFS